MVALVRGSGGRVGLYRSRTNALMIFRGAQASRSVRRPLKYAANSLFAQEGLPDRASPVRQHSPECSWSLHVSLPLGASPRGRAVVSKLAEMDVRVLLPLGEGGPKGRMRVHFLPSPGASRHPLPKGEGRPKNRFPNRKSHETRINPPSGANRIS